MRHESDKSYSISKSFTKPLQDQIKNQIIDLPGTQAVVDAKDRALAMKKQHEKVLKTRTIGNQNPEMKRNLEQLSESGASNWLSARPLKEHHFDLTKGEFQDALNLRYDRPLRNLPTKCPCNQPFTVTHAMNCHRGGFINMRHDNIRDYEATLLKKV